MKKLFLTLAVVIAFAGVISCACNNTAEEAAEEATEEATECCCGDETECECGEACEAPAEAE